MIQICADWQYICADCAMVFSAASVNTFAQLNGDLFAQIYRQTVQSGLPI